MSNYLYFRFGPYEIENEKNFLKKSKKKARI